MTVVNVETLTLITRHLLPRMIAQHRGAILNVSSSAGFLPIPGSAVYAATKAYVTSFSEALRAELRGTGVSVCALCPGPVVTEFQQVAKREGMKPDIGPTVPRCYSRTGRARCARSTRSRPAARHSGIRDEAVDASRSINANASPAMGGTDVTEETRRRVVSNRTRYESRNVKGETSCARSRTRRGSRESPKLSRTRRLILARLEAKRY